MTDELTDPDFTPQEEEREPTRDELHAELLDLTQKLRDEEAAKKRDGQLHNERIKDLKSQINEVADQLSEDAEEDTE